MRFTVPGIPFAQQRHKHYLLPVRPEVDPESGEIDPAGRAATVRDVKIYTPSETGQYKNLIKLAARDAGVTMIEGPVELIIYAFWPMKGAPRKREPRPMIRKDTKPDIDNVAKIVMDALEGIAFSNDGQVSDLTARKRHAQQGGQARVEVSVRSVPLGCVHDPMHSE